MSRFMCQREKGTDSLLFVFVDEDSEQDAVHRGAVLESAQGSSPDLPALDGVGGSDLPALIGVLETGQQIVEIVAQACDGLASSQRLRLAALRASIWLGRQRGDPA